MEAEPKHGSGGEFFGDGIVAAVTAAGAALGWYLKIPELVAKLKSLGVKGTVTLLLVLVVVGIGVWWFVYNTPPTYEQPKWWKPWQQVDFDEGFDAGDVEHFYVVDSELVPRKPFLMDLTERAEGEVILEFDKASWDPAYKESTKFAGVVRCGESGANVGSFEFDLTPGNFAVLRMFNLDKELQEIVWFRVKASKNSVRRTASSQRSRPDRL